jgi:glycosyltransferase involved in cell wall biosynthesis
MNILYLTQIFSASRGGAPLIFYDLAKALAERGHKIYVICNVATDTIDNKNLSLRLVKPAIVTTSELPPSPMHNLRYIVNSILNGIRINRHNKIDLVHTSFFTPVIAGSILSRIIRAPMIASIFDIFTDSDGSNWNKWVYYNNLPRYYSTVGRIYEKISLTMPYHFIHTISNATKNDIISQGIRKQIEVVYPAIDNRSYPDVKPINYDKSILYIGRLVFYKNVAVLIRAYKEVVHQLPSAKLVIVGEGPMKEKWQNLTRSLRLQENVIFTGHIPNERKLELLRRCSALALPSVFEGFGLVVLEAFALEKPVLVSNIPPLDEIVDDSIDGFIIPENNPHAWATRMIELLMNNHLSVKMGKKSLQKINGKFDFISYLDRMEHLYYRIITGSK